MDGTTSTSTSAAATARKPPLDALRYTPNPIARTVELDPDSS